MSQLLQPFSIFDFTPPSSPTKLSQTMNWLKRTPSSVPLPPSPTKSRDTSDDDDSQSTFSVDSTALAEFSITKAMGSLHKKSSAFLLQPQAISSSPGPTPLSSPQREASRWLSRPSLSRTSTSAPPASELGDHFARSPSTHEEKESTLWRRREASKQRVSRMRVWLTTTTIPKEDVHRGDMCRSSGKTERTHQRFDSGIHELSTSDGDIVATLCEPGAIAPCEDETHISSPPQEDPLWFSLFRLRNQAVRYSHCVGCKTMHAASVNDRGSAVWLLQGCRHRVHSGCLHRLRGAVGLWHDGCKGCAHLALMLGRYSLEELETRQKRVLGAMV